MAHHLKLLQHPSTENSSYLDVDEEKRWIRAPKMEDH
eukprot:CAMPEP_0194050488 /NCGR_PEP_ID=MMETSP0009_2-20130614/35579_1 /TAXON_ID=210454 /ORGANISM="Grammatophora oceanica, Strain CCMP 410" /LENGTH=36 /DNA_ID= /DNA_START= /DNA_END= /DNA_ORIENTATION=